jgi:cytochrome c oxidase cbb3-type subunit 3
MAEKEIDRVSGVSTTGHEWDGLKELNNPLPKWWLYVFYGCIAWALVQYVLYPAWPTLSGFTPGILGHSQRQVALDAVAAGRAERLAKAGGLGEASLSDIRSNPKLLQFALANGHAAFGDNCSPCHGSGAVGGPGYPNLQDNDWLWGGKPEDILTTLKVGIRSTHPDARQSLMPAFGKDGILKAEEIGAVADHVLSLSGKATSSPAGAQIYAANCLACHGEKGEGNKELGAPNLADGIWLNGSTKAAIVAQITNPKLGVMPTWEGRLDPMTLKSLAIYVHALGGGE